ncbi:hypothetical protein NDU88_002906 [Pleurodeles waltl]|uniref:Uncharacterized protein n=1 Tax=Pleurodeles waltl TaxID=8319 RepID=A0AAV7VBW5_PLEWA|nr:hypothetical protein NDU88_002906 [Pleurodeles waltl]
MACRKMQIQIRRVAKTCSEFTTRMEEAETRISRLEDEAGARQSSREMMEKQLEDTQWKLTDLEDRMRRNNLRVLGQSCALGFITIGPEPPPARRPRLALLHGPRPPLRSSRGTGGLKQPGSPGPGLPLPWQRSNLHGLGEALQPAQQARVRREPSGYASRSSHQRPTSTAQQGTAAPREPIRARPPATLRSPPEVVHGHLRVPRR